ncbi:membrane protein [Azorhizobium oxalatiphilum]|uniref:Membrane protein n=1 Tax=Azorhizobium oxalatiphilum TaxID=980631 RepID=A0A917CK65_9HYPH|nr:MAPEG family protein [Azorhizobium oxalatiphilum]GGF88299.1 membrane protein [Azorhizobium oxalatiphilum]
MTHELALLAATIVLYLFQLMLAARLATRERGLAWNTGARDAQMPPLGPMAGRMDRAFKNLMETFPLFAAAVLIAQVSGVHNAFTIGGAHLYFWGRVLYVPLYASGLPYVRSAVWALSTCGILIILGAVVLG